MNRSLAAVALSIAMTCSASALAQSRPPANALPLSTVVLNLEKQGYGPIVEIEFDDGLWEVKAYKDGRRLKLKVEPADGRIRSERKDD